MKMVCILFLTLLSAMSAHAAPALFLGKNFEINISTVEFLFNKPMFFSGGAAHPGGAASISIGEATAGNMGMAISGNHGSYWGTILKLGSINSIGSQYKLLSGWSGSGGSFAFITEAIDIFGSGRIVTMGDALFGAGSINSIPATTVEVEGTFSVGSGPAKSTFTATADLYMAGNLRLATKSKSQLEAIVSTMGDMYYCSDCLNAVHVVIGTGTLSGFDSFTGGISWH